MFGHRREKDIRERSKQTKADISADLNRTPSWKKVFFFTSDNLQLVLPPTIFFWGLVTYMLQSTTFLLVKPVGRSILPGAPCPGSPWEFWQNQALYDPFSSIIQ